MLGDKQEQSVGAGAIALQAKGNINVQGASPEHVDQMVRLFLEYNFPRLREEARQAAELHVAELGEKLKASIAGAAAFVQPEKLADPDVQATINDAVQASARKGRGANPDILCSLITERISQQTNDYKDVVISEAVQVVGKLTSQQISLISFVHFVTSMTLQGAQGVAAMEPMTKIALDFSTPGFQISESQRRHIAYTGACSLNTILGGDIYSALRTGAYSYLNFPDDASFKQEVAASAPSWDRLLQQFSNGNFWHIQLTSVGQAIAIANISRYFGRLDYGIWLN